MEIGRHAAVHVSAMGDWGGRDDGGGEGGVASGSGAGGRLRCGNRGVFAIDTQVPLV